MLVLFEQVADAQDGDSAPSVEKELLLSLDLVLDVDVIVVIIFDQIIHSCSLHIQVDLGVAIHEAALLHRAV